MSSQLTTLLHDWEKDALYSFFRLLFQSIQDNLLSDEDINYFIDKLGGSYPIKNVMDGLVDSHSWRSFNRACVDVVYI